jgi:nicotinamidase-related amidase
MGVKTSGVVLSTVRAAADLDYVMTVVSDACSDVDKEVHRVCIESILPQQAFMKNAADTIEFLKSQAV